MLKKLSATLLILLYFVTAQGFALNVHYCGKLVTAVTIDAPAKGCVKTVSASKRKCCREKVVQVKIKDAHQGESPSLLTTLLGFNIAKLPFSDLLFSAQQVVLEKFQTSAPPSPPLQTVPATIKNCSFRI